jgi:Transposase DDE domain.
MVYFHDELALACDNSSRHCISRVQLTRILDSFVYESLTDFFNQLCCSKLEDVWYALDGKELRGSIDGVKGEKRGENIVLQVNHKTSKSKVIGYYSGKKASEKTVISDFFEAQHCLKGKKYTLDALHNSEELLTDIHKKSGKYIVQIKNNQKLLLEDLKDTIELTKPSGIYETSEKGHGRIEKRTYESYLVNQQDIRHRWKTTGIATLVKVTRDTTQVKTQKKSFEESYYISNQKSDIQILAEAIRGHWSVEKNNYIRDVNFGEDKIKSFKVKLQRSLATILNFVVNLTLEMDPNLNTNQKRENLTDYLKTAKTTLGKVL